MTKYSEIEIETAKNLLKEGYKWIARNKSGRLTAHAAKPSKVDTYWWTGGYSDCTCDYVPIFQSIRFDDKEPTSLESIVHPQILDDAEKQYLSAVIKPFKDRVKYIQKYDWHWSDRLFEQISIRYYDEITRHDVYFDLPKFDKGTMYKGMKPDHRYTLEELGL